MLDYKIRMRQAGVTLASRTAPALEMPEPTRHPKFKHFFCCGVLTICVGASVIKAYSCLANGSTVEHRLGASHEDQQAMMPLLNPFSSTFKDWDRAQDLVTDLVNQ
jgi:hypothetical protein